MTELIVVHGHPGSGKTTQSQRLEQHSLDNRDVLHISVGNRLRNIRAGKADSQYKDIVNDPNAPSPLHDTTVNGTIFELIPSTPSNTLALIDGYPRYETAIPGFEQSIADGRHRLLGCIALEVTLKTSLSRILPRGPRDGERIRATSLEEYTRKRYKEYENKATQTIRQLAEIAPVSYIDANADDETVWKRFISEIGKLSLSTLTPGPEVS